MQVFHPNAPRRFECYRRAFGGEVKVWRTLQESRCQRSKIHRKNERHPTAFHGVGLVVV